MAAPTAATTAASGTMPKNTRLCSWRMGFTNNYIIYEDYQCGINIVMFFGYTSFKTDIPLLFWKNRAPIMNNTQKTFVYFVSISVLLMFPSLAYGDNDSSLSKQIEEAIVLSAGPKTELGVLNAERGYFEEDRISTVSAGTGFYIDSSSVTVGESEQEAVIAYRFGNEADAEITGEWLEIIATTDGWSIEWTCRPADGSEKLNDYLPNACDPI